MSAELPPASITLRCEKVQLSMVTARMKLMWDLQERPAVSGACQSHRVWRGGEEARCTRGNGDAPSTTDKERPDTPNHRQHRSILWFRAGSAHPVVHGGPFRVAVATVDAEIVLRVSALQPRHKLMLRLVIM